MAKQYSIVIDLDSCMGCHACTLACKFENGTPLEVDWHRVETLGDPKAKVGQDIPLGTYPNLRLSWLPVPCMHCENPPCVDACPTAAITRRTDGIVQVDKAKCIGCQYCSWVCPYNVPQYSTTDGTMEKCHLCVHRVEAGQEPACVAACVYGARVFGDLEDPDSVAAKMVAARRAQRMLPEYGTAPAVRYVGGPLKGE